MHFGREVGCGGRNETDLNLWVILKHNGRARTRGAAGQLVDSDVKAMQPYLDAPRCWVAVLSEILDGKLGGCASREHTCDQCMRGGPLAAVPAARAGKEEVGLPAKGIARPMRVAPPANSIKKRTRVMLPVNGIERWVRAVLPANGTERTKTLE